VGQEGEGVAFTGIKFYNLEIKYINNWLAVVCDLEE
jgi:hypothetical protein